MLDNKEIASVETTRTEVSPKADTTKDSGRVRVGSGMMRFDTVKDAGRVRVGSGMMRF